ncbi:MULTISPECIES: molybdopterin-dependent oxidoreductase [unclassified Sphingomonas]|uniref:molybdopterin-dependent oxidoreductase n=1 Tax=unclassified Sphingomonas TaxID=196159 RepID=UPI0006FC0A92|nr:MULTISPECIES: molybdopterin-dependent oxidoreductase [unclassified Sphingomonas]KQX26017.1 oxidase [Sphingomonas sp. Root1294]KQY69083.1 oxidase [Sphingomonas sp. Root50]KRB89337.1 oxidase [Sphingomonas sp. Root720]
MDLFDTMIKAPLGRRQLLAGAAAALAVPAGAQGLVDLRLPGGPSSRRLAAGFPGKGEMIVQRVHPPLLETPMEVFDGDVFTPNDRFFVRWHWADMPSAVDVGSFRLTVHGCVRTPLSIGLTQILRMPRIELAAVNQCSGNSRGLFEPRVPGAQWAHGAMGNARWLGVRLRDVLDQAGVLPGAAAVRFAGLDGATVEGAPRFEKALAIDHARSDEVMIAFGMNGEQLPLLNGFPLRLVVPGWYSTYWVKMLSDIEVLAAPDDRYWMAKAYRIPATPGADVAPGARDFPTVPIGRMTPRSFITGLREGQVVPLRPAIPVGGIALGGDTGVAKVELSADGGRSWQSAALGPDRGKYGFRRWDMEVTPAGPGAMTLLVRCTNDAGEVQPMKPIWNPGGFMRSNVEAVTIEVRSDA